MSHITYNKLWNDAQSYLGDLLLLELPTEARKPEKDRVAAFQFLATIYIKYIQVFKKLEECYDQITHPQKRRVLRHILDGVIGRILELKHEMVNLEFSEFHYFDDILSDLKLTPDDIEMPIPHYFINERIKVLQEKQRLLSEILLKIAPAEMESKKQEVSFTVDEAVRLIQVLERARQGRLRASFMREIRQREEREKIAASRGAPNMDQNTAATIIQKTWKGHSQLRKTHQLRNDEMMFLGMLSPSLPINPKNTQQAIATRTETSRRVTQETHEQNYQQALTAIKAKLREDEGPDMMETMQDQIRQWFIECRDATGKFPEYPDDEDGGSALIFKEKDPAELEKELKEMEEDKGKTKGKDTKEKDKKDKKDKKDSKAKKGKDAEEEEGWTMSESQYLPTISEGCNIYSSVWKHRNEKNNFSQRHDAELIKEEKRLEVEEEIRVQVDELMRAELINLKLAVDREKVKKSKKGKKGKKGKGKKGKKGKREKDLTPERTLESLYEELVTEGIIVRPKEYHLSDFIGEYNYLGTTLRQAYIEPMPSLNDIRRIVTEFAILPLGSPAAHEKAPLFKSMLLAGPSGTGKKMLVHAICTEIGANLFDLTATNLIGKYPGKDGLKMLIHLIYKVGRAYQPSIFFIGNCEQMFKKKISKNDQSDPKRLKKELTKSLKKIMHEDRIMLIGTSRSPFEAELKPLSTCYQKIILIPRPDYASRNLLWRRLILKHKGIITSALDISSLTKITDGYTPGHMVTVIGHVLTDHRVQMLDKKPLTANEFIPSLSRLDPVFKEEEEAFKDWYKKTPLGKKRAKAAQLEAEEASGTGKDKKGQKGGKDKKAKKKK